MNSLFSDINHHYDIQIDCYFFIHINALLYNETRLSPDCLASLMIDDDDDDDDDGI